MNNNQYYDRFKRNKESKSFYNSEPWQIVRDQALNRDDYLCRDCYELKKKITLAELVHHIKELADYPELALDLDNLRSLCNPCHNKHHPRTGKRKDEGRRKKLNVVKAVKNPDIC